MLVGVPIKVEAPPIDAEYAIASKSGIAKSTSFTFVSFEKIVILKEQFKKGEFVINEIDLFENEELEFLYQINHSRKVRSKVLHYIDHPKFGVIFQISPTKNI